MVRRQVLRLMTRGFELAATGRMADAGRVVNGAMDLHGWGHNMPWPQPLHSVWSLRSIKGPLRRAALQPALDPATRRMREN